MDTSGRARLITLTGSAGAGKSTLMRELARRYRASGFAVMFIDEDAVWGERRVDGSPVDYATASARFYQLLHRQRPAEDPLDRAAIVKFVDELVSEALQKRAICLQDWTWPGLLDMLGWDGDAAEETFADIQRGLAPITPQVIHLRIDPKPALERALAERGPVWLNRWAGTPLDQPVLPSFLDQLAATKRDAEAMAVDRMAEWPTAIFDASAPKKRVADAVWHTLIEDGMPPRDESTPTISDKRSLGF